MLPLLVTALIFAIIIAITFWIGFTRRGILRTELLGEIKNLKHKEAQLDNLQAGLRIKAHGHRGERVIIEARRKAAVSDHDSDFWYASVTGLRNPQSGTFRAVHVTLINGSLNAVLVVDHDPKRNHTYPGVESVELITGWWISGSK